MILPAASYCTLYPCCGPSLARMEGHWCPVTGVVTRAPSPGPDYAVVTGIVVQRHDGEPAPVTGIVQGKVRVGLRLTNTDGRTAVQGNDVIHKTTTFP